MMDVSWTRRTAEALGFILQTDDKLIARMSPELLLQNFFDQ